MNCDSEFLITFVRSLRARATYLTRGEEYKLDKIEKLIRDGHTSLATQKLFEFVVRNIEDSIRRHDLNAEDALRSLNPLVNLDRQSEKITNMIKQTV